RAHAIWKSGAPHILGHFFTPAEFGDKLRIQPRLVNAQIWICKQAVPVEPFDIVAFESTAVTPDIDVVLFHRNDEHRARNSASDRRCIEIWNAGRRNVEGAALQRGQTFSNELFPAID